MKSQYISLIVYLILLTVTLAAGACSQKTQPAFVYDPAKAYAAFLVVDSEYGRSSLESMKANSAKENLDIGRIEYYKPGTEEFGLVLSRLTESKQVRVVWVIANIIDINNIKNGQAALEGYQGSYRYVPIMEQSGPVKLRQ